MNEIWSMDFVSDALFDGRRLRALTIADNYTRECLAIKVSQSLRGGVVEYILSFAGYSWPKFRCCYLNDMNALFGDKAKEFRTFLFTTPCKVARQSLRFALRSHKDCQLPISA